MSDSPTVPPPEVVRSDADLRATYARPSQYVLAKDIHKIDAHARRFIELSPFLCMGTMGRDGTADVSPRGGPPGFVHVLGESQLAMPDHPGNNRLDSLSNIVSQPGVGLVFFIPGVEEVLRVNGTARVTRDDGLRQRLAVDGKPARSVVLIDVVEVYLHCAKALRRARLWDPASRIARGSLPSAGQIFRDHLNLEHEVAEIDAELEKDARENLY
jgi:PPOX class probable FMN-dependent enzyme